MSEKIDTKRMRSVVQDENYKYMTDVWQYGSSHNGQCEYRHYPCAVLKLCDEIDALRAELAAAQAEVERLRGIIRSGENIQREWARAAIRVCCDSVPGEEHEKDCPFYQWEAPDEQA